MNTRVFTIEQAKSALPQVREIVAHLRSLRAGILETRRAIDMLETLWGDEVKQEDNPDSQEYRQLKLKNRRAVRAFRKRADELDAIGCHVKDLDRGVVGFFSVKDGNAVFMSWNVDGGVQESYDELAPNARVFTIDCVRVLLPRLREIFEEFDRINEQLSHAHRRLRVLDAMWDAAHDTAHPDSRRVHDLRKEIGSLVESGRALQDELRRHGCQLRDFDEGLIDFYHVMDGKIVFLCWRRDEPDIVAWHSIDVTFRERQYLSGPSGDS